MDEYMRNHDRAYEREREQWPCGNRLSIQPMDARNLGRDNIINQPRDAANKGANEDANT